MTTVMAETTPEADLEAAVGASQRAGELKRHAAELDQQRRETLAEAAYQESLAGALRERSAAATALAEAQAAEDEAGEALVTAEGAEADAARQATDARYAAERAADDLARAMERHAEPAELTDLDVRAISAGRVAGHEAGRQDAARQEREAVRGRVFRAREVVREAQARLSRAQQAAANPPRPAVPPSEVTFGDIFTMAARNVAHSMASDRPGSRYRR